MKNIIKSVLCLLFIVMCACGSNSNAPNFTNSCCCNSIVSAGNARVFVPSAFTPNADGSNDVFTFITNGAVKYITNVIIKDGQGNTLHSMDTAFTLSGGSKNWNGKLSSGGLFEGVFTVNLTIIDTANVQSSISNQNSCSYVCSNINATISNKASCKLADQFDLVTGSASFTTNDPCFK